MRPRRRSAPPARVEGLWLLHARRLTPWFWSVAELDDLDRRVREQMTAGPDRDRALGLIAAAREAIR